MVWESIDISHDKVEHKIIIKVVKEDIDYNKWFNKIKDLKKWMLLDFIDNDIPPNKLVIKLIK